MPVSAAVTPASTAMDDTKSPPGSSFRVPLDPEGGALKEGRIVVIIIVLTGVNFLASLCNGFITVGLPRIASDLSLSEHLILWPSAVY